MVLPKSAVSRERYYAQLEGGHNPTPSPPAQADGWTLGSPYPGLNKYALQVAFRICTVLLCLLYLFPQEKEIK